MSRRSLIASDVSPPPVVPLRERFRREVASAIAAAAEEVFAAEGVHSAHVGNIAKRAGVAVGTLYNYFEDRDALLAALLHERGDGLTAAFGLAIAAAKGEPLRVQLAALVDAYFAFFVAHRPYFKILFEGELAQLEDRYPRSAAVRAQYHKIVFEQLDDLFGRLASGGQLRADREGLYSWLLFGMLRGVAVRDLRAGRTYEPADGEAVVNLFLDGARA